ncbi:MAG: hypothetical protein EBS91_00025 [Betaproteobacteria bacterium]|nr:hypothetical protein [Betaproteobacteria bacterium]NCA23023.1 hypothetical protein [Betaproteobacteria bacterium]
MKKPEEVKADVKDLLLSMAEEQRWPVPVDSVAALVEYHLRLWQAEVSGRLEQMYKDWEARVEDDDTLYTLGLRRAQDVVMGVETEN